MEIPIYYDPMLSKLITYGKTRDDAIQLMLKAINDYEVVGIQTTLAFGAFAFNHEAFRSGHFNTNFVKSYYSPEQLKSNQEQEAKIAALLAVKKYLEDQNQLRLPN